MLLYLIGCSTSHRICTWFCHVLFHLFHLWVLTVHNDVNSPHKWPVTRKKVSIWWRHHGLSISINYCAVLFGDVIAPCHASPSHQKVWYRLCMITGSLSSTRRDFNHLIFVTIKQWYEILIYICVSEIKLNAARVICTQNMWEDACYENINFTTRCSAVPL